MNAFLQTWWQALLSPDRAGGLVLGTETPRHFTRHLTVFVALLYACYGISMGLFRGLLPAAVSGVKLPFLYLFTLVICFPPLYVLNCLLGPGLTARQAARLLLLATSANAIALASYTPLAMFFTLTTSDGGYGFLVLMHVAVFGLAGVLSLLVIGLVFRGTAQRLGRSLRLSFILGWGFLYALIGTQMSWVLRPWIGSRSLEYTPLRPLSGSFIEALWSLIQNALGYPGGP